MPKIKRIFYPTLFDVLCARTFHHATTVTSERRSALLVTFHNFTLSNLIPSVHVTEFNLLPERHEFRYMIEVLRTDPFGVGFLEFSIKNPDVVGCRFTLEWVANAANGVITRALGPQYMFSDDTDYRDAKLPWESDDQYKNRRARWVAAGWLV